MASVFKRGRVWYSSWFDHTGESRERSTKTTDKKLAERIVNAWSDRDRARATGLVDTRVEAIAAHEAVPLTKHIADYSEFLESKGTGSKSIGSTIAAATLLVQHMKAERIPDITASGTMPDGKAGLFVRCDLNAARAAWIAKAGSDAEREQRGKSDYLTQTDAAGRVVDFHSLRVHYISRVVEAGANVKQAMELARHPIRS